VQDDSQLPVLKDLAGEFGLRNRALLDAGRSTRVIGRPSILAYADVSTIVSCGIREILVGSEAVSIRNKLEEIDRDVRQVLDGKSSDLQSPACYHDHESRRRSSR
jgi:hypothetical protein